MLPGALHPAFQLYHTTGVHLHIHHLCSVAAAAANAPGQRTHCAQHPHQRGRGHKGARRLRPPSGRHQHHRMKRQHQVHPSQQFVQIAPDVVRKALPQRDDQHGREEPHRPLAHVFRQVAEGVEPPVRARPPHRAAHQRDQQVFGQLRAVMQQRQHDGPNARPLVQAVDLVHAAKRPLQPHRAQRQHHDERHQRPGPQPGEQQDLVAPPPDIHGRVLPRHRHRPQQHRQRQRASQNLLHHRPCICFMRLLTIALGDEGRLNPT